MPVYSQAPAEVREILDEMIDRYHQPLRDAEVTFSLLFAKSKTDNNGDATGAALKLHGYRCAAVVKIIGVKERAAGREDAEIVIDGDRWDTWSLDEKRALLDHELAHVNIKSDPDGVMKRDDMDRPCLKLRLHDFHVGVFDAVVRRHGIAAFEAQQMKEFVEETYTQEWLPFMMEHAEAA